MGEFIGFSFDIIKCLACIFGAILMTMYFLSETKKLKADYNNPESKKYKSKEIEIDLKASFVLYLFGIICLIAIMVVVILL